MQNQTNVKEVLDEFSHFLSSPNAFRSLAILLTLMLASFWLSRFVAKIIIRFAQFIAVRSDNASSEEKKVQLRRVETYLSVLIALIRAVIVGFVAFYSWQLLSPVATQSAATIGASAFFIVIAGATVGIILRDVTAGSIIIAEKWFDVGNFIKVEPFMDVSGVVERITLRSTKLRSLNGEVVWIHNQYIQAAHVTYGGIRTMAVDIFVNNQTIGKNLIEKAIATMPIGTIKIVKKPKITRQEKWGEKLWYFTVVGSTPPGREWLMEKYFIESLQELDSRRKIKTLVRPPIARFADEKAERSFKRAVRNPDRES